MSAPSPARSLLRLLLVLLTAASGCAFEPVDQAGDAALPPPAGADVGSPVRGPAPPPARTTPAPEPMVDAAADGLAWTPAAPLAPSVSPDAPLGRATDAAPDALRGEGVDGAAVETAPCKGKQAGTSCGPDVCVGSADDLLGAALYAQRCDDDGRCARALVKRCLSCRARCTADAPSS